MKYANALLLAAAGLAESFVIPELSDGMYLGTLDVSTGELTTELVKVGDAERSQISPVSPYGNLPSSFSASGTKRDRGTQNFAGSTVTVEKSCNPGDLMDAASEHAAWDIAAGSCDNDYHVNGRNVRLFISGNSAWYVCNYSDNVQGCWSAELTAAGKAFDDTCGHALGTSSIYIKDWKKAYGRAKLDQSICDNCSGCNRSEL